MKHLKQFYIIPVIIAMLAAIGLGYRLFPASLYMNIAITVLLPALILAFGFRWITYQRIRIIRNQLYQILQTLEEFDVDEPKKVTFEPSPFLMFNELNEYLIELVNRVRTDYQANKQFTQNASHELQTPLAIIKGHVELLLQSPRIAEKEMESLGIVLQNTNRLAKLNSALILLSKIEHQRFQDTEMVNFRQVTEEILHNFKDLLQIQEIEIRKGFRGDLNLEMSRTLAEILIANLVQNAIRYNVEEGYIQIVITPKSFTITNPGKPLKSDPVQMFKRFKRVSEVEESLGLGLSIVKRICEQYGLSISYTIEEEMHSLRIDV